MSLGVPLPGLWRRAAAAAEPRADLPILVVVELTGGNDGLNTVVPHADDIYHKSRPTLRIEPEKVLKLDDRVGLHPALKELHALWESGDLAVIQGVGYPNPNRSHFRSMEIWQTGVLGPAPPAGWLGRAADAIPRSGSATSGRSRCRWRCGGARAMPQALASLGRLPARARCRAWPMPPRRPPAAIPCWTQVRRQFAAARELSARLRGHPRPAPRQLAASPDTLEGRLETIRRLIEADFPLRVYYTAQDGIRHPRRPALHPSGPACDRSRKAWPGS